MSVKAGHPKLPLKTAERLLDLNVKRWLSLLSLGAWRVTYEITDYKPRQGGEESYACGWPNYSKKRVHIKFWRGALISRAAIEELVIHELLHCFDERLGENSTAHELIYRLTPVLRRMRQKATRRE